MNILILGAGRVGSASAIHLSEEQDNEVTVVDIDDEIPASMNTLKVAFHGVLFLAETDG